MSKKTSLNTFLERAYKVFGNRYDYSKVDYKGVNNKVIITCREHGDFLLRPKAHYDDKRHCPKCDNKSKSGFSFNSHWAKNTTKNLYVIEINYNNENFIKFGLTTNTVKERFSKGQLPYSYKILFVTNIKGSNALTIESDLKKIFKKDKYTPLLKFKGNTECLNINSKYSLLCKIEYLISNY